MFALPQIAIDIRDALLAAEARLGRSDLAVKSKAGKSRIVAVTRNASRAWDERPLTDWLPTAAIPAALGALA